MSAKRGPPRKADSLRGIIANLEVGQSFYGAHSQATMNGAAQRVRKDDNSRKFAVRIQAEGSRIWRTA